MWIMTTEGFYSVVEHRADPDLLLIRSRARQDLENALAGLDGTLSEDTTIKNDRRADYPWRMIVHREDWALAVARMTHAINYDNFKTAVSRTGKNGWKRSSIYHSVWSVLTRMEPDFDRRYYGPRPTRWSRPVSLTHDVVDDQLAPDLFDDIREPVFGLTDDLAPRDLPSRSVARSDRKRAKKTKGKKS